MTPVTETLGMVFADENTSAADLITQFLTSSFVSAEKLKRLYDMGAEPEIRIEFDRPSSIHMLEIVLEGNISVLWEMLRD